MGEQKEFDRERVIEILLRNKFQEFGDRTYDRIHFTMEDVINMLKGYEAEWIDVDDEQDAFDCSACGAMVARKCLYCPGCGARMKNGTRAMVCV